MFGAVVGDVVGSRFEWHNIKTKDFELITPKSKFTDDTVMTIAVADALAKSKPNNYSDLSDCAIERMQYWGRKYHMADRFIHGSFPVRRSLTTALETARQCASALADTHLAR